MSDDAMRAAALPRERAAGEGAGALPIRPEELAAVVAAVELLWPRPPPAPPPRRGSWWRFSGRPWATARRRRRERPW